MEKILSLLNPLAKYKWLAIISTLVIVWSYSLYLVHSHDVKACEDSKTSAINAALEEQSKSLVKADENLQTSKIKTEIVRQSDKEVINNYIERTKNETVNKCDGNFSIGTGNASMYNQLGSSSTKSPN